LTSITAPTDARLAALHDWLATTLRTRDYTLAPASADANTDPQIANRYIRRLKEKIRDGRQLD